MNNFIENKASNYSIVLPDNACKFEKYAAQELQEYIYQATGVKLEVIGEGRMTSISDKHYLILGDTDILKRQDFSRCTKTLGRAGYIIKSRGGNVFLCGGGDLGTIYAVYGFLSKTINFEAYADNEISITRGIKTLPFSSFDIEDKPDFPYRIGFGRKYYFYSERAHKLKFNTIDQVFVRDSCQPWHNSFRYISPEVYNNPKEIKNYHPKWFSEDGTQLHYTAYGDKNELQALRKTVLEKLIWAIERTFAEGNYPEAVSFTHQDIRTWAEDGSLAEYKEKYGNAYPAATLIHFLNPVARELKKYMQAKHGGKNMNIVIFAYNRTEPAPVVFENGKYKPVDDSVILEDNISVIYAAYDIFDITKSIAHERNIKEKTEIDKWSVLTNNLSFWIYSTYFSNYMMFIDTFTQMQENFKALKEYNPYFVFNESNWNYGGTAFNSLRQYLYSKLEWDTNADVEQLKQAFFKNYYKAAAASMLKLFKNVYSHMCWLIKNKNDNKEIGCAKTGSTFTAFKFGFTANAEYWPIEKLKEMLSLIEKAYSDIEYLKAENIYLHTELARRINSESIMMRYLMLKNYSSSYTAAGLYYARESFRSDCEELHISNFSMKKDGNSVHFVMKDWYDRKEDIPVHY